ncbi:MAG: hypothetical protein UV73_C0001G0110 [Candidatus Gottesmanbacteria bacterium GW2011_GWA2_43_14]|uniref:Sulfatase N-terminal domain-containing protein n=1 Tax=Candidatus Gottesmanbacteria bacterium GW2011_GWA2_43_14 TaxID=1618443 RepID=A0A0G1DLU4_9BACT|nr:MAG: hypothetical protein UV73_C0001G0110 [Candidatus Gottesmanbacteria bacterium GW2011_GWA2_43_14]
MNPLNFPWLHPFLMSVYPVLGLYQANLYQVLPQETYLPFLFSVILCLCFFLIYTVITRKLRISAVLTSISLYLFFSYGHLEKFIKQPLLIYLLFGGLIFTAARKLKYVKNTDKLHFWTNIFSLVLVAIPLVQVINYQLRIKVDFSGESVSTVVTRAVSAEKLPDIYFIIFDRYASADSLKKEFDYDLSPFTDYLKGKNFFIASKSWANYTSSAHSLTATLNMDYLDNPLDAGMKESQDWLPLYRMLENNRIQAELKKLGYKYYHFGDWWWPTGKNRHADENVNLNVLSEFSAILVNNSALKPLAEKFRLPLLDYRYTQWRRIRYKFDKLKEIPVEPRPTFVFAHMLVPHEPFVFRQDGSFLPLAEDSARSYKTKYLDQIEYLNREVIKLTDKFLEDKSNPPIIIFQADEGPYPEAYEADKQEFDWSEASQKEIALKMSILNAVYLPGEDYKNLKEDFSPVNNFRLVKAFLYGQEPELLPDLYQLTNMGKPYDYYRYDRQ